MRQILAVLVLCLTWVSANATFFGWSNGPSTTLEIGYDDSGTFTKNGNPFVIPFVDIYEVPYPEPATNLSPVLSNSIVTENGVAIFYASTARGISKHKVRKAIGANTGVKQDAQSTLFDGPATMQVYGWSDFKHVSSGTDVTHILGDLRVKGVISPGGRVQVIKTFTGGLNYCYETETSWSNEWDSGVNETGQPISFDMVIPGKSHSATCYSSTALTNTNYASVRLKMYAYDGDVTDGIYSEIYIDGDSIDGAESLANIDIQPNDDNNFVETEGEFSDKMYVSILGSNYFDTGQIDAATVRFGPGAAAPHKLPGTFNDKNGDGYNDLNLMFRVGATGITCEYPDDAELSGEKYNGQEFSGSSFVTTPDCPDSGCHP